jgi:hypothetical protein
MRKRTGLVDHVDGYLIAVPDGEVVGWYDAAMAEIGEQRRVARDVGSRFELRPALLVPAGSDCRR